MKTYLLIDGFSFYSKFFVGPMKFYVNSKQKNVGNVLSFFKALINLKKKEEFKYCQFVVVWNRGDLKEIQQLLDYIGVIQVYKENTDIGDIIASYINFMEKVSFIIYTDDIRYKSMISDKVVLYLNKDNLFCEEKVGDCIFDKDVKISIEIGQFCGSLFIDKIKELELDSLKEVVELFNVRGFVK